MRMFIKATATLVNDLATKARENGVVFEWTSIKRGMLIEGTVASLRNGNLPAPGQPTARWVEFNGMHGEVFILEALFPDVKLVQPGDKLLVEVMPLTKNGAPFAISFRNLTRDIITQ